MTTESYFGFFPSEAPLLRRLRRRTQLLTLLTPRLRAETELLREARLRNQITANELRSGLMDYERWKGERDAIR